jgi:signal transduction histidine kinase
VVTHNVSVMVVQAGAARRVLDASPANAREALLAVEGSGRTALGELRHLLGLLNPATDGSTLGPQPGLRDLGSLIERVSTAGLSVELHTSGTPVGLPPGIDLAAYRVVQEALTNVLKHAGPATVAVQLKYTPAELVITVINDTPVSSGAETPAGGSGQGLIGLRERVALYDGSLEAGPRLGGGWRVTARIPLPAAGEAAPDMMLSGSHAG